MQKPQSAPLPNTPLIDNPHAPELFVAEPAGFYMQNGVVMVTFVTAHVDHSPDAEKPLSRIVNARVVMPIRGAQLLALGLYDFLKARGLDPAPKPPDEKVQ